MDDQIAIALISGGVSLLSAFGSIILKDRLDRRQRESPTPGSAQQAAPAAPDTPRQRPSRLDASPLFVAVLAIAAGYSLGALRPPALIAIIVVGAIFSTPFVLLWRHLREASPLRNLRYQLEVIALWAGALVGASSTLHGRGLLQTCVIGLVASMMIGGVTLHLTRRPDG